MKTKIKTSIEVTQINKHFFSNSNKNKNVYNNENDDNYYENKEKRKYISKICVYDFFSINEATICNIIQNIPFYENNYHILYDYDFITIGRLSEKVIQKIDKIDKIENMAAGSREDKYLLFQYKNNKCILFSDFIFHLTNPKLFISHVLDSFSYLLHSLIKLNDNNICFFHVSPQNIIFNIDCGEKPILLDFQKSLHVKKLKELKELNEQYIVPIIKKTNDYTYKPLEVYVLFYLIHNDLDSISDFIMEEICETYIKNLHILSFFSQTYQADFKLACFNVLQKYINMSRRDIINEVIQYYTTWDNYSLSVLYFHIVANISRVFLLKNSFFSKLSIQLIKNINPDPLKRERLEETVKNYENLYDEFRDWSWINTISNEKMTKLFQVLSE